MPPFTLMLLLFLTGLVAGFVDAIAGGGGLLTVPALLLAGLPAPQALATNKGQSVFGSGMALLRFTHSPLLSRPRAKISFLPALLGAALGAWAIITFQNNQFLTPLVLGLLGVVAVFMLLYRPPPPQKVGIAAPHTTRGQILTTLLIAFLIAAYDGFFGPGTGTFLILAYVLFLGDNLDAASANAKVVNFASNLAALGIFAFSGLVQWPYAIPMAAGQALGGFLGAHLTIRHGQGLVRYVVLLVSLALMARLIWQLTV